MDQAVAVYTAIVRFLCEPFLERPESLRLDCEVSPRRGRVLIRLAVEGEDKGRIFGRGGRNIQSIKTVLQAVADSKGQTVYLEIYGSPTSGGDRPSGQDSREGSDRSSSLRKRSPRRNSRPRSPRS